MANLDQLLMSDVGCRSNDRTALAPTPWVCMSNAFINKLGADAALSPENIGLREAECAVWRDVPARHDLIREGDPSGPLFVILSGWACRYQMLPEGLRQITAFLMPGDCCGMHLSASHIVGHRIATLTDARVASIPRRRFEQLIATRPVLTPGAMVVAAGGRGSAPRVDRQHGSAH